MKKWALSLVALCCASSWAQTALIHNVQGYSVHEGKLHTFSAVKFTDDKIDGNVIPVIKDNIHREFFIVDNAEPIIIYLQNIKKFLDI